MNLLKASCLLLVLLGHLASAAAEPVQEEKSAAAKTSEYAIFAGGCFWCMEPPFEKLQGVTSVESGYTGGEKPNPTYKEVSKGTTGHVEAIRVTFDPSIISYEKLLEVFWRNIDPLNGRGQFCDNGFQYTSAIFWLSPEQKASAEKSKQGINQKFSGKVVTRVVEGGTFFEAEDYHQDYYKRNPIRYKFYRYNCGRDKRLEKLWGES